MNEITITKQEYDELKACQIMLWLYQKSLIKCASYSEWRKDGVTFNEEDLYYLIGILDIPTADNIKDKCDKQKAEKEKAKDEKPDFPSV